LRTARFGRLRRSSVRRRRVRRARRCLSCRATPRDAASPAARRRRRLDLAAMPGFSLDLRDQLSFYGAYHAEPWNQAVHVVFVPALLWSAAVAAAVAGGAAAGGLLLAAYSVFYLLLEPVAGAAWAACVGLPTYVTAAAFAAAAPAPLAWAAAVQVVSWAAQIVVGHAWLEKRRPALLDSFFQSLALAPFFVFYELLFLLGYRPALRAEVAARARADIAAWRAAAAAAAAAPPPPARGKAKAKTGE
jgi:uncharacterized membrane protein YGL010W